MSLAIETRNLTKRFGERTAVDQVDLQVRRGDIFGFLGQNGAGKSTTIRMLLGLIRPTQGSVSLLGHSIPDQRQPALRKVGAIVDAPAFYEYLTGQQNLEAFSALSGRVSRQRYEEVVRWVHLTGRQHDKVRIYSHGMRQRLGLAQALLPNPELLILDEPTDGLDPQGIREIRQLIGQLAREQDLTIFLSSHLLHEVERTCSRIAIIDSGRLLYQGSVDELLKSEVRFRIRTDRCDQAYQFLSSDLKLAVSRNGDSLFLLKARDADIAAINAALVQHGFQVFEISRHAPTLEDIYFQLTS